MRKIASRISVVCLSLMLGTAVLSASQTREVFSGELELNIKKKVTFNSDLSASAWATIKNADTWGSAHGNIQLNYSSGKEVCSDTYKLQEGKMWSCGGNNIAANTKFQTTGYWSKFYNDNPNHPNVNSIFTIIE